MGTRGVNKVIILGNLGQDPEVKSMPNGDAVANISVATSEEWKDKQTGEAKSKVEWHRVVLFGKLAEIAGEYLKKGSKVYLEGALQTRKWQNQEGKDQYTTEIVLQGFNGTMQMLDSPSDNKSTQTTAQQGFKPAPQAQGFKPQQAPAQQAPARVPTEDDMAWVNAINSGEGSLQDINDIERRAYIKSIL